MKAPSVCRRAQSVLPVVTTAVGASDGGDAVLVSLLADAISRAPCRTQKRPKSACSRLLRAVAMRDACPTACA